MNQQNNNDIPKLNEGMNEKLQRICMERCKQDINKDSCYSDCVQYYDYNECQRRSTGYSYNKNFVPCVDVLIFAPTANKYGELPK